ncbi:MAG: hypothetical protein IIB37_08325 [Gemmatimonadetes bacterium]|nr:hypothetical protein [Gemmatimonadota bacterium]
MPNRYILLAVVVLGGLFRTPAVLAQDAAGDLAQSEAPRIFFDCSGSSCDNTYHRTEIPWVTWVRDLQDADLYVIMTSQRTGANGREYLVDATGRDAYADYADQTSFLSLPTDTQRERLDGVSLTLALAFARFAQYAGFRDLVSVQGNPNGNGAFAPGLVFADQVEDPWNLWTFRISGNGNFSGEESRTSRSFVGGLSGSRVTPTWKQSYFMFLNYNFLEFSSGFVDERTDFNFNTTVVYSLAQFFSIGFTGRVGRNTRENQRFSAEINPAIEYSFFPYEESTRRSLTAFYEIGPVYYEYMELTQDKFNEETRYQQSLSLEFSQRQRWGDARASIDGSHYLHDFDRYNLRLSGNLSFRIFRGLDLTLRGSFSLVSDQLWLPLEDLTEEELLTGVRSAATDRRHSFSVGLSYQFGSIFNNVVNNRFPGGGGGFGGFGGGGGGGNFRPPGGGRF